MGLGKARRTQALWTKAPPPPARKNPSPLNKEYKLMFLFHIYFFSVSLFDCLDM